MANIKISQLSATTATTFTDTFLIVQAGVNKKVSLSTILNNLDASGNIRINSTNKAIATTIASQTNSYLLNVNAAGTANNVAIKVQTPDSTVDLHVNANVRYDGIIRSSSNTLDCNDISPVTIGITTESTKLTTNTNSNYFTFNLPAGAEGQVKHLVWSANVSNATQAVVVCNNLTGSPSSKSITFTKVGQGVTLKYYGTAWMCIGQNNHSGATAVTFSS